MPADGRIGSEARYVDWRWTSQPLTFFGIHISITLFFPLFLICMHFSYLRILYVICLIAYVVFLFVCKSRKVTPLEYARMIVVRSVYRRQWGAR